MTNVPETTTTVQLDTPLRQCTGHRALRRRESPYRSRPGPGLQWACHPPCRRTPDVQSGTGAEVAYTRPRRLRLPRRHQRTRGPLQAPLGRVPRQACRAGRCVLHQHRPRHRGGLGGHKATADAKRAEEDAAGGLVACICNHNGARRN